MHCCILAKQQNAGIQSHAGCFQLGLAYALQVPFRRVHLQEGNGHVDLYDTSGEQVGCMALID